MKNPGHDHPIAVAPTRGRVVVRVGGQVVADSLNALTLAEPSCQPVQYIPRAEVDMALLSRTDHATHCPWVDASCFGIPAGGARAVNAGWSDERPFPAVTAIAGRLAFCPDGVEAIGVTVA